MFRWKDYEENSALFIGDIDTNVALLRHKDFQLTDCATGCKAKMKASCLEDAKSDAENFLKIYWNRVKKELDKNLSAIQ